MDAGWALTLAILTLFLGLIFGVNLGVGLSLSQGPEQVCKNLRISFLECPDVQGSGL